VSARIDADVERLQSDAVSAMKAQGLTVVQVDPEAWRAAIERSWKVIRGVSGSADFFDAVVAARDSCGASGGTAARARRGAPAPRP
jgi:TRAP-type C4-dicarboxylate transport system substrate-binding protein